MQRGKKSLRGVFALLVMLASPILLAAPEIPVTEDDIEQWRSVLRNAMAEQQPPSTLFFIEHGETHALTSKRTTMQDDKITLMGLACLLGDLESVQQFFDRYPFEPWLSSSYHNNLSPYHSLAHIALLGKRPDAAGITHPIGNMKDRAALCELLAKHEIPFADTIQKYGVIRELAVLCGTVNVGLDDLFLTPETGYEVAYLALCLGGDPAVGSLRHKAFLVGGEPTWDDPNQDLLLTYCINRVVDSMKRSYHDNFRAWLRKLLVVKRWRQISNELHEEKQRQREEAEAARVAEEARLKEEKKKKNRTKSGRNRFTGTKTSVFGLHHKPQRHQGHTRRRRDA